MEHIKVMGDHSKKLLDANRSLLFDFLDQHPEIDCVRPEYGTTVFPLLKQGNVDRLAELLRTEYQTLITPGRFFGMPDHFRIGLSCLPEIFSEGLKRVGMAIRSL